MQLFQTDGACLSDNRNRNDVRFEILRRVRFRLEYANQSRGNKRTSVLQKYGSTEKCTEVCRSMQKDQEVCRNIYVKGERKSPDFGPENSKICYTTVFNLY